MNAAIAILHCWDYVRSKAGKATFRCDNDHEWRTRPHYVAEGTGCPMCGIGERSPEEMSQIINPVYLCLLTHPDKPGFIKITLAPNTPLQFDDGWVLHRYRDVEEGPALAESLIWELQEIPKPNDSEQIELDVHIAEEAFRNLIYRIRYEIALAEKEYEKKFQLN